MAINLLKSNVCCYIRISLTCGPVFKIRCNRLHSIERPTKMQYRYRTKCTNPTEIESKKKDRNSQIATCTKWICVQFRPQKHQSSHDNAEKTPMHHTNKPSTKKSSKRIFQYFFFVSMGVFFITISLFNPKFLGTLFKIWVLIGRCNITNSMNFTNPNAVASFR